MQTLFKEPKGLTPAQVRAQLPKIGDIRMETPTVDETAGHFVAKKPKKGVVVYVNAAHLWYTVQFANGVRESYKVPKGKQVGGGLFVR